MMTFAQYQTQKAQGYTHIPLVQELLADLDTPLSLYLKLANRPMSYLLESVVGGERFARYSFIGLPCRRWLKVCGQTIEIWQDGVLHESRQGDPIAFIEAFQAGFKTPEIPGLPRFTGGLAGYFGYESVQYFEPSRLGKRAQEDVLGVPDIFLMLSTEVAVIDNLSGKIYLIVYADTAAEDGYRQARARLEEIRTDLRRSVAIPLSLGSAKNTPRNECPPEEFKKWVDKIKDYIHAGDCMQVVPMQRMSVPYDENPVSLYRALRTLNPSPYLFYYHFDDFQLVASSPEILVRREGERVTVRPLAGTRARGKDAQEDAQRAEELLADAKEIAEHVMLIDLGRNDLGRICQTGSVQVTEKLAIERYSHVMHIVSNVEGCLKENTSNLAVLAATFPAGTLSGAPKIRAMEIIEELEPAKRGVFGGAAGYLGFGGDMDMAITIRSGIIKNKTLYVQSGAGIVADSQRDAEWEETQNKARAVIRAAEMVAEGLDK